MTDYTPAIYALTSEPDAGRGVRFYRCWLGTTKDAGRLRWLAPWLQSLLCSTWNYPLTACCWAWRFNRQDRRYAATLALAGLMLGSTRLGPVVFPWVWATVALGLGLLWVVGPLYSAPAPRRDEW